MSEFRFSKKSLVKLEGVHPNLVKVVKRALELSNIDFLVLEGVRTTARQKELIRLKKSQTMQSKHLVQNDGYGHAVDLAPYPISWQLEEFYPIALAMKIAAEELNIKIRWGGGWCVLNNYNGTPEQIVKEYSQARLKTRRKAFIDAPHFELI